MKIEYKKLIEGWPVYITESLDRAVSQYQRYYKYVKVGITCDPERRCTEHSKCTSPVWEKMEVKYQTTSKNFANKIEDYFINTRPDLVNIWTGYSNMTDSDTYYVYFLLSNQE